MFQDFKGKLTRKRCKLRATLVKRGRKRGLFGFLRGRPWASRVFELTSTYTTSTLRYYKDDECRGSFDLIGCTAAAVAPSLADGRPHAFEIRLASRERFLAAADNAADAARWVQALEASGVVPLATDRLAETLSIDLLGEDRETVAYRFLLGKSARDDMRRQTHGEIDAAAIVALEAELEETFPKVRRCRGGGGGVWKGKCFHLSMFCVCLSASVCVTMPAWAGEALISSACGLSKQPRCC